MSRLEFRSEVAQARPRSAWGLVLVASATLWITGQLSPATIATQIVVIAFTFYHRTHPLSLQRSPIFLNLFMMGITASTIAIALRGSPTTVSLAHFAALSQCLQLMDARPRKTEFLFVALALFQVILAANLTDSVFFPPLVAAFLVSVTWTLIVHTLRSEALEAREPASVSSSRPPGLGKMTAIASVASLVVALALFVTLPRFRSSMMQSGLGSQVAVSGFSDRVELGAFGQLRMQHDVVLRVETIGGDPPPRAAGYWRGLAFDTFDGRSWSISPSAGFRQRRVVAGSPRFGLDLRGGPEPDSLVQRIVREPVEAGVLFGAGLPRRVEGPFDRLELDANDGLSNPMQVDERIRYTLWTDAALPSDGALRVDQALPPAHRIPLPSGATDRYVLLPQFDPRVGELARRVVAGAETDADRARAIERHLRKHGRYTDAPPPMGTEPDHSPIEDFLLEGLAGHCEYFASGMVVLARSVDLPSRLVNGFAGGRINQIGGFTELTSADAHAWVEIHYRDAGWVRYDPTPPDRRLRSIVGLSFTERLEELGSVIELWWFQRVVDFDTSDQMLAFRAAWAGWRTVRSLGARALGESHRGSSPWPFEGDLPFRPILLGVLCLGLLAALHRLRLSRPSDSPVPATYTRALRLLARRGFVRRPGVTARGFAEHVSASVAPEAGSAFRNLTESYLAERFGARAPSVGESTLIELRNHLQ